MFFFWVNGGDKLGGLGRFGWFGVFGFRFRFLDILEGQRADRRGRPKMAPNLGWGKISRFRASSLVTKVIIIDEKVGSAQN